MRADSIRLVALDAAVVALVSAGICLASDQLLFMTILVPAVILARFLVLAALARPEAVSLKAELVFFLVCTCLGAFNDWNSVCNHRIYDYTVPHYLDLSTIPLWMLLFWGMILRFIARLARWEALSPPAAPSDRVGLGGLAVDSGLVKVATQLVLVLVTRQAIYRFFGDPILSWLPFAGALLLYLLLCRVDRHDLALLAIFLVGGPLIEVLYIQVGGLHAYKLGWFGGVPLWIVLWWLVIVLIWKDLAIRIERWAAGREPGPGGARPANGN